MSARITDIQTRAQQRELTAADWVEWLATVQHLGWGPNAEGHLRTARAFGPLYVRPQCPLAALAWEASDGVLRYAEEGYTACEAMAGRTLSKYEVAEVHKVVQAIDGVGSAAMQARVRKALDV